MNVNINSLRLTRNANTIAFKVSSPEDTYPADVYLLLQEVKALLEYDRVVVDDCSQFMVLAGNGARVIKLNSFMHGTRDKSGEYASLWYTFPLCEIKAGFKHLLTAEDGEYLDYTDMIGAWAKENAPNVSFIWEAGIQEKYTRDMESPLLKWENGVYDFTAHLRRIAENSSNGNPVNVYISFDLPSKIVEDIPSNYYFYICDEDTHKMVMNGGIIAHYSKRDETYTYSMHT